MSDLLVPALGIAAFDAAESIARGDIVQGMGSSDSSADADSCEPAGNNGGNGATNGGLPIMSLIDDMTDVVSSGGGGGGGMIGPAGIVGDTLCLDCVDGKDIASPSGPLFRTMASVGNNVADDVSALIDSTGCAAGQPTSAIAHALTAFGGAVGLGNIGPQPNDLLSSILGAPEDILNGHPVEAVCNIVDQAGNTVVAAGDLVNRIVDTANLADPLGTGVVGNAADLVGDITGAVGSGPLLEAAGLDPDGNGPAGNLVDVLVKSTLDGPGALIQADAAGDGRSSQSHNLIDVGAGPSDNDQASVNVLNPGPGGNDGAADINVLNTGSDGPRLVDADVATDDDALDFAGFGGAGGGDSLLEPLELLGDDSDGSLLSDLSGADMPLPDLPAIIHHAVFTSDLHI